MGHYINAFLGHTDRINLLSKVWLRSPIQLSQGLSMLFLTTDLYDEITALVHIDDEAPIVRCNFLTPAIVRVLEEHSRQDKLAYIETDYAGGAGMQMAILYENGKQKFPPIVTEDFGKWKPSDDRAINIVLKEFRVNRINCKDEFDSIGLGDFRDMYDEVGNELNLLTDT
jgi:hypothetical protein